MAELGKQNNFNAFISDWIRNTFFQLQENLAESKGDFFTQCIRYDCCGSKATMKCYHEPLEESDRGVCQGSALITTTMA